MTTWLSDASANRHIKTYVKDFLDISGNFSVRQRAPISSSTYEILGQVITNRYQSSAVGTGISVDMDISGNTIVVGEYGDTEGSYKGRARAFRYDASAQLWYQHGNAMVDPDNGAGDVVFGHHVYISDDGNVIVVVDYAWTGPSGNEGKFHIFRYNSSTNTWDHEYSQRSSLPNGYFGTKGASFSGNGNVFAINEQDGNWSTYIYAKTNGSWSERQIIAGTSSFQTIVPRLNYDGSRLIVRLRVPRYYVRVYEWNGTNYNTQIGSDISNPSSSDGQTESTAINKAGDIVAFASNGTNLVYVYRYNNATSDWVQHGSSLSDVNGGDDPGRGYDMNQGIHLNDDGDYLLFGTDTQDRVSLYKYTEIPLGINGYYPLYTTAQLASNASPDGSGYHSHDLENTTYYMPNGLNMNASNGPITQWHGDYSPSASPFAVNGYYPLYTTAQAAINASPDGSGYHSHDLTLNSTTTTYYMPNGLTSGSTQWHGDFVTNGDWVLTHVLTNGLNSRFGRTCGFNNDASRIIVGARYADLTSTDGGAAYVYQLTDAVAPTNDKIIDVSYGTLQLYPNITEGYSVDRIQYLGQNDYLTSSFGISVDINADGSVIVVGAPYSDYGNYNTTNNTSLENVGRVFVYQKTSSGYYLPLGNHIEGDVIHANVGRRVAIDNSGNRIAIGLLNSSTGTSRGRLQMYELSGNVWTQLGSDINGDADNDRFGEMAMHISGNGKVVVGHAGYNSKKYIRAYEYVDATGTWTQLGSDITDIESGHNDWSYRVQLSDDGRILAFGNSRDDTTGRNNGKLQVYKFTGDVNSGSWSALGSYITVKTSESGSTPDDSWGWHSVSLSSDGYTVAWQSFYHEQSINQQGRAQVYRYSELMGDWMQLGSDITKQYDTSPVADIHFGRHCHLSGDGNTIVVTSNYDDDGASNAGGYYVYKYINGDWTQVATYFENLATELYVGEHGVRISKDGTHIISGSYRHDNATTDTGMAVVCKLNPTTSNNPAVTITENQIGTKSAYIEYRETNDETTINVGPDGLRYAFYTSAPDRSYGASTTTAFSGLQFHSGIGTHGPMRIDRGGSVNFGHFPSKIFQASAFVRWAEFSTGWLYINPIVICHDTVMANQQFMAASNNGMSDKRIKMNIQPIDDDSSLEKLRLLNPCTYEYLDKMMRGYHKVEGFIAQEVKEILPHAVNTMKKVIPNIIKLASLEINANGDKILTIPDYDTANLEVDASGNIYSKLVLYDNKLPNAIAKRLAPDAEDRFDVTIIKVLSSTSVQIKTNLTLPDDIFVYGQDVDNFHVLDKNRIFTVMTSALQEVDRQLQAERTKTASLETELASLIADVTALENA